MQLSIVTVCYNEKDIGRTCESIVSQSCQDFEWIVVDGGSTDGSLEIIKHYKERIDILISEPDNGIYDAMNKGIRLAKGKWINFMNGGDTFADNCIVGDFCILPEITRQQMSSMVISTGCFPTGVSENQNFPMS